MKYICIHHSLVSRQKQKYQFLPIDRFHKQRFNMKSELGFYGGYNFLIEPNGIIYQYRRIGEETAAQKGHNRDTISICLAGNFDIEMPTTEQINALRAKLKDLMYRYNIPIERVVPHRVFNKTKTCYGSMISNDWIKALIKPETKPLEEIKKQQEIEKMLSKLDVPMTLIMRLLNFFK